MAYIYCITNELNGKQYVGKTTYSVNKRWEEHCSDAKKERCEKRPLYDAIKKYGSNNFVIETIQDCDELELNSYEIFWIDKLNTYKTGYNATLGGDGSILFDYKEIIETYKQGGSFRETALKVGCCIDTVSKVIHLYNLPINKCFNGNCKQPKKVIMYNLDGTLNQIFESYATAGRWLVENGYAKTYNGGVRQKIGLCVVKKQKTAYKHIWELA